MPANEKTSQAGPAPTIEIERGHHALRKGRVSIANGIYLITTTTHERQKLFAEFNVGCAAAKCFEDTRLLGDAKMLAWVLMPDHWHGLVQLGEQYELSVLINRLKSASARKTNHVLQKTGQVWAHGFHDHALRSEDDLQNTARYIVANPIRAGLVTRVGDYPFWNAVWLGQSPL